MKGSPRGYHSPGYHRAQLRHDVENTYTFEGGQGCQQGRDSPGYRGYLRREGGSREHHERQAEAKRVRYQQGYTRTWGKRPYPWPKARPSSCSAKPSRVFASPRFVGGFFCRSVRPCSRLP